MSCTGKCPECEGVDHHWRADTDYRDDPAEVEYACLHCGAKGVACPACEGWGTLEDRFEPWDDHGLSLEQECPACRGWGIVEVSMTITLTPKPKGEGS